MLAVCLTSQQHASVSQGRICSDKERKKIRNSERRKEERLQTEKGKKEKCPGGLQANVRSQLPIPNACSCPPNTRLCSVVLDQCSAPYQVTGREAVLGKMAAHKLRSRRDEENLRFILAACACDMLRIPRKGAENEEQQYRTC